jgi:signal transduction histidine kinase
MKNKLSVLLADDEAIIRRKVRMMFGDRFRMDEAPTAEATRAAIGKDYDAVLLDIVFPDGNGIELCAEIKKHDPHRTVIITSSMQSVDAWNEAFQAGADGYLEKKDLLEQDPRKIELIITNLAERNRLRREAEEINAKQAELLSVLSHDVRAPFQALLGTIELLRQCRIPSDAARNVETLHNCAREQLGFINALLELLRLESRTIELRLLSSDINLPVNQCLQSLKVLALQKEIQVRTNLGRDLPKMMLDIGRVSQLVNNLMTNAVKFTPRGGKIDVLTQLAQRNGIMGCELIIADTGIGIAAEEQKKVFQRFYRGRAAGTEGETGSGLGLAICDKIVHLHGGALELNSGKTKGTVATAWFPVEAGRESSAPAHQPGPRDQGRVEQGLRKEGVSVALKSAKRAAGAG